MAHIQSKYLQLWKPQNLGVDKISSQKMFVDNIDAMEAFALSILKRSNIPVASIDALRSIDTSDTTLYTTGMTIMVKSNGIYFFDRSNSSADDGKTIIAPTTGGGRWISDFSFLGSLAFKDSLSKSDIGLGNVDNTSDANKPVSTAQATAIADAKKSGTDAQTSINTHSSNKSNPHNVTKEQVGLSNVPNVSTDDQIPTYTQSNLLANIISGEKLSISMGKIMKAIAELILHLSNKSNPHSVTKEQVGLGNVDNTSDANKPVSTAQQTALDNKVPTTRKINGKVLSTDVTLSAADTGAIPTLFSSNNTSTNDDDLDNIINTAFNAMTDNSTRIIRVNFSMQHEFFVSGISAIITIYRFTSNYGCLTAMTYSPTPDVFVRGKFNGTWGRWVDKSSVVAVASVEG